MQQICFFKLFYVNLFIVCGICVSKTVPKGHPKIDLTKSVEKQLMRMVISRYQKYGVIGRPVANSSVVVHLQYGLQLIQILDLDENKQILRTNCWSMYRWHDPLLQWNETEYGNITELRIFPDQVWTPDIQLYNFADERISEHRIIRIVVHSNGNILWVPAALFKSTCQVGITFFPFDSQICELEFGSWMYDHTQMDIGWWIPDNTPEPMPYFDFSDYVVSNEWITDGETEDKIMHLNRTRQIKSIKRYRERNQTINNVVSLKKYPVLCYRLRLHRNPSFYVFILVIPSILLSSLTIVVFWLPPESPAKMMLGMNIFVAFFLLLLLLSDLTPNAVKEFPLIGAYFCLNMIMITLSTFLATLVIHLYYRGARNGPLPAILHRVIVEGLGRLMLIRQSIPLPEEKKTLSHIVTRAAISRVRRKIHVPELTSSKFATSDEYIRPCDGRKDFMTSCLGALDEAAVCWDKFGINRCHNHQRSCNNLQCTFSCSCNMQHDTANVGNTVNHMQTCCPTGCLIEPKLDREITSSKYSNAQICNAELDHYHDNGNMDSEDSPIMLGGSTSLERDVRELKRYVHMFVNRQKESTKKNFIAMEWRTMALVLDRLFFFMYIGIIGITVVTSLPSSSSSTILD